MSRFALRHIGLFVLAAAAAAPALAQHVILDAPGLVEKKRAPEPPAPRNTATIWPRLDPGSVLCATADDLDRHAANMVARVNGGESLRADCRLIAQPTAIDIVSRQGLGRTEVKLKGPNGATGWTDAWLPDKAPTSR